MGRTNRLSAVAVVPQGLEAAGSEELTDLGAHSVKPGRRAVSFDADMACLYRMHLQARLPFRLLRQVACFPCQGRDDLYDGIRQALDWERWLHPSMSFRVDVTGTAPGLNHSHFTALQVKNALVDAQRDLWGERSSIDLDDPDLSLHLHLGRGDAQLSLDGSGGSLHRRGYRAAMGVAPLKENLAAGLIRLTGWDGTSPLVDPCCGSGILLIEAALAALQQAPGLGRRFALEGWADFQPELWAQELHRARQRRRGDLTLPLLLGIEADPATADQARANVEAAGLSGIIRICTGPFEAESLPDGPGVLVCNPPYGQRIGTEQELDALYSALGQFVRREASGWQLWLLSGNPKLTGALRLKASRRIPVSNGGIDCRWLHYDIR
ncbi:class I SAM-dependent RNA methyltransferase [Synechococcus sp. PROS-U-1]|uniref:THUMP domain-containing class I SAM-dependent RNA methyltransferase n=1 Tax=Synechococcus sp. PROS-U-1 TaxID=1400866 RepID=UPI001647AABC|nr:THUMP domain-containing protein [Synechococcus sp. PROS-U-1]QNJ04293.1 putative N6-adenine-specific DNA methylase [Synechococcus sp. PROS-U-1]